MLKQRIREVRKNESGFTLIELLIVIVILGVLAGVVVLAVGGITDRGEASACRANVKTVQVAVEAYYAKNDGYPATLAELAVAPDKFLSEAPTGVDYVVATGVVTANPAC